jgi:hypothetical protein
VTSASLPTSPSTARRTAAIICGVEALVMAVFGLYAIVRFVGGGLDDPIRVLTEGLLVLLFAAGAALLAKLWLGRSGWPGTPTVVWHVLLIPVAWGMWESKQYLICAALALAIVAAIWAAVTAGAEATAAAEREGSDLS